MKHTFSYKVRGFTHALTFVKKLVRGFTLIELLIVLAIIGYLASIVMNSVSFARGAANDAKRKNDLHQINVALDSFYDTYKRMPKNYNKGGCAESYCQGFDPTGRGWFGACDKHLPGVPGGEDTMLLPQAYNASMQELVDSGFLGAIPSGAGNYGYCYFNFGAGPYGAMLVTMLEREQSVDGIVPSVRPWASGVGTWCEKNLNYQYCLSYPY